MGQAKQRGTFEQRRLAAIERDRIEAAKRYEGYLKTRTVFIEHRTPPVPLRSLMLLAACASMGARYRL